VHIKTLTGYMVCYEAIPPDTARLYSPPVAGRPGNPASISARSIRINSSSGIAGVLSDSVVNRVFDFLVYLNEGGAPAVRAVAKLNRRYAALLCRNIYDRLKQGV
jgi:hypothetical protein